jgi:hypothetical protein
MPIIKCSFILAILVSVVSPLSVIAQAEHSARLYRTRAEQREVGLERELTPWMTASGLGEVEWLGHQLQLNESSDESRSDENSGNLQLGLRLTPFEFATGELILVYETDRSDVIVDEALAAIEYGAWELEAGRLYTPFGEYFSRFVSGPALEFGETRASGAKLSYGPNDGLDLSITAYRGLARKENSSSRDWDWTLAMEVLPWDLFTLGLSFQTDLADSESELLKDAANRHSRSVPAISGYLAWFGERFDMSIEVVSALRSFNELDPDRNRPMAWNVEFAHVINSSFEVALRMEGSDELEDEPEFQVGVAATWRAGRHTSVTVEYLRGQFKDGLATNDDDESYDNRNRVGVVLSVAF